MNIYDTVIMLHDHHVYDRSMTGSVALATSRYHDNNIQVVLFLF